MGKRHEPVIEGFIEAGNAHEAGWYLPLQLIGLDQTQGSRIREQALEVLDRYGSSERATIVRSFSAIVDALEQRLSIRPATRRGGASNAVLIHVTPDATDPWSQIRDDRGTAVAFALRFAEDADPAVSAVWRGLAEAFDEIRFTPMQRWVFTIGQGPDVDKT